MRNRRRRRRGSVCGTVVDECHERGEVTHGMIHPEEVRSSREKGRHKGIMAGTVG